MRFVAELPFIGREKELEQLFAFYKTSITADTISVLWIQGPAGIGKTRLLNTFISQLSESNAIVLHLKMYPDTPFPINDLLTKTIANNPSLDSLTGHVRTPSNSAISTVRHLARLRPTVLIIEDLHLLDENAQKDFSSLLYSLSGEPVCTICAARPGEYPAYAQVLPFLTATISLNPLNRETIEQLVKQYAPLSDTATIVSLLHRTTHGIPLILRSVFTTAFSNDKGLQNGLHGSNLQIDQTIHTNAIESIKAYTTGLVAHLTDEERFNARRLALLGEIFSEEAANELLGDTNVNLELLSSKGVLMRVRESITPLFLNSSTELPWGFTHTLLHEALLAENETPLDNEELPALIASQVPLFSMIPLQQISKLCFTHHQRETVLRCLRIFHDVIGEADANFLITFKKEIFQLLYRFYERNKGCLLSSQQHEWSLSLAELEVRSLWPTSKLLSKQLKDKIKEFSHLTENPQDEITAQYRVSALGYVSVSTSIILYPEISKHLDELDDLIQQFPSLLYCNQYMQFLGTVAFTIANNPPIALILRLWNYGKEVMEETKVLENPIYEGKAYRFMMILLQYYILIEGETEEIKRIEEKFLNYYQKHEVPERFLISYFNYLFETGKVDSAVNVLHSTRSPIRTRPIALLWEVHRLQRMILLLSVDIACGASSHHIDSALQNIAKPTSMTAPVDSNFERDFFAMGATLFAAIMQGEEELMAKALNEAEKNHSIAQSFKVNINIVRLMLYNIPQLRKTLELTAIPPLLRPLVECVVSEKEINVSNVEALACQLLQKPIYTRRTVKILQGVLALLRTLRTERKVEFSSSTTEQVRSALLLSLEWCQERGLAGYMSGLIRGAHPYFCETEVSTWKDIADRIRVQRSKQLSWVVDSTENEQAISLSLIGTITLSLPGETPQRIQGARARLLLGLAVANQLSSFPLSYHDFCKIASDTDEDLDKSAGAMRATITRLRSMLGKNSIVAGRGVPPRLNFEVIKVDVIEVVHLLDKCNKAVKTLRLRAAKDALLKVLGILEKGPFYPSLYHEVFEAARQDFEAQLRSEILSVAQLCRREGDIEEAASLLQHACTLLPNDDGLTEELIDLLELLGRYSDALSIKRTIESQQHPRSC